MDLNDDLFDLLANPERRIAKSDNKTSETTIDDEIIRLLNIKLSEINVKTVIDKKKFEKLIEYIKILK